MPSRNVKTTTLFIALALFVVGVAYNIIRTSFDFNFDTILLLMVLPFCLKRVRQKTSTRYGFWAIAFLLLFVFLRVNTIYFLASVFILLYMFEVRFGQLSALPVVYVLILSPVAVFFTQVIGFEVRLLLSDWAAQLLALLDSNYSATGNVITYGENEFHVDPVCLGLKMVTMGFFVSLILVAYQQQKRHVQFHFFQVVSVLLLSYVFVILSNFMRIIFITVFRSEAGALSHEIIGLLCFTIYVVLPLYWCINKLKGKTLEINRQEDEEQVIVRNNTPFITHLSILFLIVALLGVQYLPPKKKITSKSTPSFIGLDYTKFQQTCEAHNVIKLTNSDLLVYLKPPTTFYSAEHTPLICWRGSGYTIAKEQLLEIKGREVYFSELQHGTDDELYSVWWYQSATDIVTSQFRWRLNTLLEKKGYYLVNIVSHEKSILEEEVRRLFSEK